MKMTTKTMTERIEEVISILKKEKDVEEVEYSSTGEGINIKIKRFVGYICPTDELTEMLNKKEEEIQNCLLWKDELQAERDDLLEKVQIRGIWKDELQAEKDDLLEKVRTMEDQLSQLLKTPSDKDKEN